MTGRGHRTLRRGRGSPRAPLRRIAAALGLCAGLTAPAVQAQDSARIDAARYAEPTTRYAHGVLGDDVEWGALILTVADCAGCAQRRVALRLPEDRVFEDIAPRLFAEADGTTAVAVVESHATQGARLAVYDAGGLRTATPWIGRANRWLAPFAPVDLDADGRIEIAYIDRPHLAKVLRIWRLEGDSLTQIATAPGLTNHRIGWDFIAGGIRDCGTGAEILAADAGWQRIISSRLVAGGVESRDAGPYTGPDSLEAALTCG